MTINPDGRWDRQRNEGVTPSGSRCQPTASAAEEASSQSGIPNACDLQIWPFGHGVVCSALGGSIEHGVLILTAVPDECVPEDWRAGCPHDWETVCSWQAQRCVMTFPTPKSVDSLIRQLRDLKRNLASAIEARRAETQGGSVADESAQTPKVHCHD